jgi:hypothetical protein
MGHRSYWTPGPVNIYGIVTFHFVDFEQLRNYRQGNGMDMIIY